MMDLLPTFARLAGAQAPRDRMIDGYDIWPLMSDQPRAKSPYEAFFYYCMGQLQAMRSGKWKLHLPLEEKLRSDHGDTHKGSALLYDLENDIGEAVNVADAHRNLVERLLALAERARQDLGDLGRPGRNQRPAGKVRSPKPRLRAR